MLDAKEMVMRETRVTMAEIKPGAQQKLGAGKGDRQQSGNCPGVAIQGWVYRLKILRWTYGDLTKRHRLMFLISHIES